ncbi:MAG: TolC family protein [Ignavibacteria bacterium]|nr:TolC family protein [Ignavibacteria bacterium]
MKNLFLLPLMIISFVGPLFPQEAVDLREAVRTATDNNPDLYTLKNSIDIQKYNIKSTRGNLFPTLSVNAGWTKSNTFSKGGVIFQNGIPIIIGDQSRTQDNFSFGINSQVMLFDGFANYQNIDLERENELRLNINYEKVKYDIVINVFAKFFNTLMNEYIVKANERSLANSKDQLEMIKEYVNVGKKTIAEIYKQDVQVAQDELNLEKSRNDYEKSKVELLTVMYDNLNRNILPVSDGLNLSMEEQDLKIVLNSYKNEEELVKSAVNTRYDYQLGLQDIVINETKLDIAEKYLYYPTLSAFGNYNISGNKFDEITSNRVFTVGLSLNYSIFQGFKLDVNKQIAEVNIKQKSEDLKRLEHQIRSDIKKATLDLNTSYKQIDILDRNIKSAEQDKYLSEENFRIGYGTLLDVQTATVRYNNLVIEKIKAVYNFYLAKAQIDYLSGKLKY